MSFWNRLKSLFGGDAPRSAGGLLRGVMVSGQAPRRGTRELLVAYKRLPWVRSAFHRVANDVASIPFCLYRAQRSEEKSVMRRLKGAAGLVRRNMLQEAIGRGDVVEVDSHPFLDLIGKMNPALGGMASHVVTQLYVDLKGETFQVKELNGLGQPVEMWPVPPHWMISTPGATSPFFMAAYMGWQRNFPETDVTWVRQPDPENPYGRGTGIGEALADELDIDELAAKHLKNWFFNNAVPPAILNLKGMGEEETIRTKERIRQEHLGVDRAHQLLVTNSEDMQLETFSQTFKDQEIAELRKAARDIVIQVMNIPPELAGIVENSNRATIDAADYLYSRGVLCPRKDFLCSAYQADVDQYDDGLILGYVNPVPEDREFKKSVMVALPSVFTIDEIRKTAGEPPLPNGEGDELYAPTAAPMLGGGPTPPAPTDPAEEPDQGEDEAEEGEQEKSADPLWARKLARRRTKALTVPEMEKALDALRPERLSDEAVPVWNNRVRKWGQRALDELGVDSSFDMRNPLIASHIDNFATNRIDDINEVTRSKLRDSLREGIYAGEGVDDLQRRVADVFDFADRVRSRRIARTEVVGSSNFANVEAFAQSGVVASKEWLSVPDAKTRDTHVDLDGATVPVRGAFVSSSGARAQHPGGFGVAEEDINCRCSALPVVDAGDDKRISPRALVLRKGMSKEERAEVWKRFDRRLGPWEKQAAAAFRRGFRKQEHDVMHVLDELA